MFGKPYAPIQEIVLPEFTEAEIQVFLKREDLAHPFISGNKWRKLKYHFFDAKLQGKTIVATFGGAYSNHLLATANAGAAYGFKTIGFVRGEPVNNHVLSLCKMFGMELFFVDRKIYSENKIEYALQLLGSNQNVYIIPEGGNTPLGEKGIADIIPELTDTYHHIFCSVGTGCTLKGLINGITQHKYISKIHGVCVLKGFDHNNLLNQIEQKYYEWHGEYHFGGYAKVTDDLKKLVAYIASKTGVLLDYVYEGKMMFALLDLIKKGHFKKNEKILAMHNGGTIGLISML